MVRTKKYLLQLTAIYVLLMSMFIVALFEDLKIPKAHTFILYVIGSSLVSVLASIGYGKTRRTRIIIAMILCLLAIIIGAGLLWLVIP